MPKTKGLALTAMITVAVLWGLSFLSTKILLQELPPIRIAFSRFLAASVLLGLTLRRLEPTSRVEKRDALIMALVGFCGTTLYFVFENTGLRYTSASNAVLIIATIPAFTVAIEGLIRHTRISLLTLIGVAASIAGVLVVVGPDSLTGGTSRAVGNLLVLAAAMSWVAFNETAKPLFARYSKLALTTYSTWFGTGLLLPLALFERQSLAWPSPVAWLHLAYLAVICSAAGFIMYLYALDNLGSTTVTSYLNILPVVGVAGSVVFLHETLRPIQVIGGLIIIAGVTAVSLSEGRNARAAGGEAPERVAVPAPL